MSITGDKNSAPLRVGFRSPTPLAASPPRSPWQRRFFGASVNGEGELIDVSMLEATLVTMGWAVSNWLIAGITPEPMGNENVTASPSGTFKTGDGLLNIAANQQEQFNRLCEIIGRKELADDPRFVNREDRKIRRHELNREIEVALAAKSAKEWSELFNENGVPSGEVLSIPQVLQHPQTIERDLIQRFGATPGIDRDIAVLRSGFRLASGDPQAVTPPPVLGADTEKILIELGYDQDAIHELKQSGAL